MIAGAFKKNYVGTINIQTNKVRGSGSDLRAKCSAKPREGPVSRDTSIWMQCCTIRLFTGMPNLSEAAIAAIAAVSAVRSVVVVVPISPAAMRICRPSQTVPVPVEATTCRHLPVEVPVGLLLFKVSVEDPEVGHTAVHS